MSIDVIGNFITVIRNGARVAATHVDFPYSKLNHHIAEILREEGFVRNVTVETDIKELKKIRVHLKFVNNESVIHEIVRISKPGRRVYEAIGQVAPVIGGLGITILSTHKGIMTQKRAKDLSVGGEILCTVW